MNKGNLYHKFQDNKYFKTIFIFIKALKPTRKALYNFDVFMKIVSHRKHHLDITVVKCHVLRNRHLIYVRIQEKIKEQLNLN